MSNVWLIPIFLSPIILVKITEGDFLKSYLE